MPDITNLWNDQTFEDTEQTPWDNGTIAISPIVNNQNSAYNSLDITLFYSLFEPDGRDIQVGSQITAIVEERVNGNLWVPIAQQGRTVKGSDDAMHHIIRIKPTTIVDPSSIGIAEGDRIVTWISNSEGSLGAEVRVRLVRVVNDTSRVPHTKIKITGYAREYDTQ